MVAHNRIDRQLKTLGLMRYGMVMVLIFVFHFYFLSGVDGTS